MALGGGGRDTQGDALWHVTAGGPAPAARDTGQTPPGVGGVLQKARRRGRAGSEERGMERDGRAGRCRPARRPAPGTGATRDTVRDTVTLAPDGRLGRTIGLAFNCRADNRAMASPETVLTSYETHSSVFGGTVIAAASGEKQVCERARRPGARRQSQAGGLSRESSRHQRCRAHAPTPVLLICGSK